MARIQKRRLYLTLVAILLSSVLAWGFGCGGGGGGGGGEGVAAAEPTPEFQALQYFPLTSSWETDNWTLFIDERQHDVNGTRTRANPRRYIGPVTMTA
jgi:hypothetical protein